MKVIDTVLPEPKTEKEAFNRWMDNMRVEAGIAYGKKIQVKTPEELLENERQWHNRQMVKLYGPNWRRDEDDD